MAVVINCDDAANYAGMRATFYDSSYVIHPAQPQMPCNADFANPDKELFYPKADQGSMSDAAFKDAMIDMGFRTQSLGAPMFSSWTGTLLTDYYAGYRLVFEDRPEQNRTATGKELAETGIDVKIAESVGSEIIWITQ